MSLHDGHQSHSGDYVVLTHWDLWQSSETNGQIIRVFLDLSKKYWEHIRWRLMSAARRKNHDSSSSSQTSASSQIQNSLMKAEARFPLGRTLVPPQRVFTPLFLWRYPWPFSRVMNTRELFWGLLNIGSELKSFQEIPIPAWLLIRVET